MNLEQGSKKYKILLRMVTKEGKSVKEVELKKYGKWEPRFVFQLKPIGKVVSA